MKEILIALLVVGGTGILCSLMLVVSSYFFKIEEEEKTKQIREVLPGANCGACGYSGCDEYARALALEQCPPHLCIPGSTDVAAKLSKLLKVEVKADDPKVAFVQCNGKCDIVAKKALYDGPASCKAMAQIYGGPNSCSYGCLGCGDCASACKSDAICILSGIAHVDPRACIGCGVCVAQCPKGIISLRDRDKQVAVMCSSHDSGAVARKNCSNACIGCKKCEKNCPTQAIQVVNQLAKIDYDKCTGCGLCASSCPVGCIKTTDFISPVIR